MNHPSYHLKWIELGGVCINQKNGRFIGFTTFRQAYHIPITLIYIWWLPSGQTWQWEKHLNNPKKNSRDVYVFLFFPLFFLPPFWVRVPRLTLQGYGAEIPNQGFGACSCGRSPSLHERSTSFFRWEQGMAGNQPRKNLGSAGMGLEHVITCGLTLRDRKSWGESVYKPFNHWLHRFW